MTPERRADRAFHSLSFDPRYQEKIDAVAREIREAVAEEREACARTVEGCDRGASRIVIADAIRARGEAAGRSGAEAAS